MKSRGPVNGVMAHRRVVPLLLVLVACAALVTGQGPERLDERTTSCWPCHVAWPTPLQTFYTVVAPEEAVIPAGEVSDYTVQVKNAWLHDMTFLEPGLDISNAPSLKFFDGRQPVSESVPGTIRIDPLQVGQDGPAGPQRGHVVVQVPVGATDVTVTLEPTDAFLDQDLRLRIHPGVTSPNGTPAIIVDDAGPGEPEVWTSDMDTTPASLGFGNWTIEAEIVPVDPVGGGVTPVRGDVPFEVTLDADFRASENTLQFLSEAVLIKPDQSHLVTWRLEAVGPPSAGETVTLVINSEVFWEHLPSSAADDYANVTKSVVLDVYEVDGNIAIGSDVETESVAPVKVGISMAAVSEAVGYATTLLLVLSVWTGGIFGKASRRQLNRIFGGAKRRVAFHNFVSYGLTAGALVHLVLFIIETKFHWTLGIVWGGIAMAAMIGLGFTGALQVPMIRRWNYGTWRWSHLLLAYSSLVFTVVHLLLDGTHFGAVQELDFVQNWYDPLGSRERLT